MRCWSIIAGVLGVLPCVAAAEVAQTPSTDAGASASSTAPVAPQDKPYLIGLERTLSDAIVQGEGRVLAGYLSAALGHPVKGRIYKTYDDLADALAKGEVDLAWINPYSFVRASEVSHVFPVAKVLRKGDSYRAVLFVKADSKFKTLSELKRHRVAWVDKSSSAGFLFPQAMLLKQHIDPAKFFKSQSFAGTHRAVCDAVASGEADVGATFHNGDDPKDLRPDGCIETMGPAAASQFVGIAMSDRIPSEVIAARADFDQGVASKLSTILVQMNETQSGRDMLKSVFRADGFGVALDTDYDPVRQAAEFVASGKLAPAEAAPAHQKKKRSRNRAPSVHLTPHHSAE